MAGLLEKPHIYNYVTEVGDELRIKGNKPNGDPFKIGIEAIDGNDINPLPLRKIIAPGDGAVNTSGNYRKFYKEDVVDNDLDLVIDRFNANKQVNTYHLK